jgi:hypothetical protein
VPATPGCRYVALSHVWGPRQLVDNVEVSSELIILPRTVSDSCLVAQGLGYRHLWVGRYVRSICIMATRLTDRYGVWTDQTNETK